MSSSWPGQRSARIFLPRSVIRSTARCSRLYRNFRPSWYLASWAKVRARREPERLELALVGDLGGSVALVGEELRAAPVERAPLDDEHLGLLAGLEQPEDLVLGAAVGEPRRCGALDVVLVHGGSLQRGCERSGADRARRRLAERGRRQEVSARSRRGDRQTRSCRSALLAARHPAAPGGSAQHRARDGSGEGNTYAIASTGGAVAVTETASPRRIRAFEGPRGGVPRLDQSPRCPEEALCPVKGHARVRLRPLCQHPELD